MKKHSSSRSGLSQARIVPYERQRVRDPDAIGRRELHHDSQRREQHYGRRRLGSLQAE